MPITYLGSQNTVTNADGVQSIDAALPSGTQTGDMLIAVVGAMGPQLAAGGADPGLSTPAGWTLFAGGFDAPSVSTSYGFRLNVYYHKIVGGEAATVNFTSAAAGKIGVGISAYRGADTLNGYAVTNNPGDGTTSSYATNNVTIGDGVRLMSAYGDRTGNTQAFSGGTSYVRNRVESSNVTFELGDSNGPPGAGSYKKTLQFTNPTGVGVFILFGMSAAADTPNNPVVPPSLVYTVKSPVYEVDATKSASGMGGAISFTVEYVSGATLNYEQVTPGYFNFQADDTDDSAYNIVMNETGNPQSPVKQKINLAAINPNPVVTNPGGGATGTSINETVVRQNGNWA